MQEQEMSNAAEALAAGDLLFGADAICAVVFGGVSPRNKRRVYGLADARALPLFRMGGHLCGLRSQIVATILSKAQAAGESAAVQNPAASS